jgi:hypothetical protein
MVERAKDAGFLLEALQTFVITGKRFRQDLNGYGSIEAGVASAIHLTHTACTHRRNNLVRAQAGSRDQSHVSPEKRSGSF